MKKIILIIFAGLLLAATCPVKCQNTPAHYTKGWGTELNFNPFDGSLSLNNASGQIKVRKFLKNDIALRAAISIGYKYDNDQEKLAYGTQPYDATDKKTSILTALNLGVEKHFNSEHRLSPYIGFDIGLGYKSTKQELEYNSNTRTVKGAWEVESYYFNGNYYITQLNYDERGFLSTNASILTGFDFYMDDNFYLGYEFGFGYEYIKYSKIEITKDPDYPITITNPDLDSKSWRIGPRLLNGIRIGYNF
jgi:hypothetical protein